MILIVLGVILAVLLVATGGKRGVKTIITLAVNALIFLGMAYAVLGGMHPVFAAIIACAGVCAVSLFFSTGLNVKSIASFASVLCVVIAVLGIVEIFGRGARIEGFSYQKLSEISGFSWIINVDMGDLTVACMLIGLIGAIVDTSIAVSSALYEIDYNNPDLSFGQLYASGLRVGRDVLGTTCNTLYFAFLGGYMALMIWFALYEYGFGQIINSAAFCETLIRSLSSAFGCILIMPVTSLITAALIKTRAKKIVDKVDSIKAGVRSFVETDPSGRE